MENLTIKTKAVELGDHEGEVTIAVNCLNVLDAQNDISATGSFTKTLNENFQNIRHYLNHDSNILIGCPIEGKEENGELVFKSALCLDTEVGKNVYALYKLYNRYGNTLQHSIGVTPIKRSKKDKRVVEEWKLHEFSTLTKVGACPGTHLIDIKSMGVADQPDRVLDILKAATLLGFGNSVKSMCEDNIILIEKALNKTAELVTCDCGFSFDYNTLPEHTLEKEIEDTYRMYLRWMIDDIVNQEVGKLEPEMRQQIQAMISTHKSLSNMHAWVECPKCGRRVYKSDIIHFSGVLKPKSEEPSADTLLKQAAEAVKGDTSIAKYISERYSRK